MLDIEYCLLCHIKDFVPTKSMLAKKIQLFSQVERQIIPQG